MVVAKDVEATNIKIDSAAVVVTMAVVWRITATISRVMRLAVPTSRIAIVWYVPIVRSVTWRVSLAASEPVTSVSITIATVRASMMATMTAIKLVVGRGLRGDSENCQPDSQCRDGKQAFHVRFQI